MNTNYRLIYPFFTLALIIVYVMGCNGPAEHPGYYQSGNITPCTFQVESNPALVYPAKTCKTEHWSVYIWDSESHHHVSMSADTRDSLNTAFEFAKMACNAVFQLGGINDTNIPGVVAVSENYYGGFTAPYPFLEESCYNKY